MFLVRGIPLPQTLRALRHRNYMLLLSGQIFSLVGSWMQSTGQQWLVYSMTKDAFLLGLVGFAAGVPVLALGLVAGVVADTYNRHRIILIAQVLLMLQAFALGFLTLSHDATGRTMITFGLLIMFSVFAGVIQAFDMPARQSFLMEVVPKEDLGNAIALNSLTFNAARVVGPAIAGAVIAHFQMWRPGSVGFGEGMCFILNGVSFIFVLIQLKRMKFPPGAVVKFTGSSEKYLVDGLRYVMKRVHIRALLIYVGMMALFGIPYLVLMPVFAKTLLKGDSSTYGNLLTSVGVGAMIGGVLLARRKRFQGLGRIIVLSTTGFSITVAIFSWLTEPIAAYFVIGVVGFCMVSAMISSQTLVQTLVSEHYRGRVMSLYTMMAVGLFPFGSLIAGAEAQWLGVSWAQTLNAGICLMTALVFAVHLPKLREAAHATPEYQKIVGGE